MATVITTEIDIIEAFRAAMREHGIDTDDELIPDGRIRRVHVRGDRKGSRNGWYVLHTDGRPAGAFGSHKLMPGQTIRWTAEGHRRMSAEEQREFKRRMREQQRRREAAEHEAQARAADLAARIWAEARPAETHPYLKRKGIRPHVARVGRWWRDATVEALLVPIVDAGAIVSLQAIFAERLADGRDKDFIPGSRKGGCYCPIGPRPEPHSTLVICEGFATGASIHEATGLTVIVAFDAGNLEPVARVFRERFPEATIIVAADNDQWTKRPDGSPWNPGCEHATRAAAAVGGRVVIPTFPADDPERPTDFNDLALRGGLEAVREAFREPPHEEEGPPPAEPMPEYDDTPMESDQSTAPFLPLGYDHGVYYYLARGAKQVIELTGSGHTKGGLLMLAPLHYWEREFPANKGANWDMASNALLRWSERAGVYDPMRVRGRGAWWDDGVPVLHLGDRLIRNGEVVDLNSIESRYIYEAAAPIRITTDNPLTSAEAVEFVELCKLLSWEKPINAILLAGWCVVASICGALRWRPHIWLTGPAGSGKSWIYENILCRSLGDLALAVASETTEAGLRQVLGNDARPVVFDEAEGESTKAQARIQNVMALMRQASSETSAAIIKGTVTGEGVRYRIRSCFAFSSIGVGLQQHADHTRVTVLSLTINTRMSREERAAHFQRIQEKWHATLTPEFVERLHARTVRLIPVIRRNAETFAVAGASVIGTRRLGDQLGALIAGAYSLFSGKEISLERARAWLETQDWSDAEHLQEERDEIACLQRIIQHVVTVQTSQGRFDRSIGELLYAVWDNADNDVPPSVAHDTLRRHGIKWEGDRVLISNTHTAIAGILRGTPWSANWGRILKRIEGADTSATTRFGADRPSRATVLPREAITGG